MDSAACEKSIEITRIIPYLSSQRRPSQFACVSGDIEIVPLAAALGQFSFSDCFARCAT